LAQLSPLASSLWHLDCSSAITVVSGTFGDEAWTIHA